GGDDEEASNLLKLKAMIPIAVVVLGAFGVLAAGCVPDPTVIAGAGSDTTYWAMAGSDVTQGTAPPTPTAGASDGYNASQTAYEMYDVPPVLVAPFPGPSYTVPADPHCGSTTYDGSNPPPNGSSAGITALVNDTNGCVDYA